MLLKNPDNLLLLKGSSKKWSRGGGSLIWGRDQSNLDTNGANLIRRQLEQGIIATLHFLIRDIFLVDLEPSLTRARAVFVFLSFEHY